LYQNFDKPNQDKQANNHFGGRKRPWLDRTESQGSESGKKNDAPADQEAVTP
jgi:hypothetical protein